MTVMLAVAAIGCGGAIADGADGAAATPVVSTSANGEAGALVELQGGLPTGHTGAWYTERIAALGFRVGSLRQEDNGASVYRVVKHEEAFDVRIMLGANGRSSSVEIVPLTSSEAKAGVVEAAGAGVSAVAGEAEPAPSRRVEPVAEPGAPAPATPPAREPAVEPRVPAQSVEPRPPSPPVESRAPSPAAQPRAPAPGYEPAPPPPPRRYVVTVPAGSRIAARLDDPLSSGTAAVGDAFAMTARESVWADGIEVIPAGSIVWGHVAEVERAGRPNKGGRLVLAAEAVQVGNDQLPIDALVTAEGASLEGRDSAREDVKEIAVGAGLGGLVGGLLGGKKGVLIGVLAGGGGTFVATRGEEVELPESTTLVVELRRNLEVTLTGPQ